MADHCYRVADANTLDAIVARVVGMFDGFREKTESVAVEVLDSFDWRLFNEDRLLLKTKNRYAMVDIRNDQPLETIVVTARKPLRFYWEFPESNFTKVLENALKMRALMPICELKGHYVRRDLLNSDQKIAARLVTETMRLVDQAQTVSQCRFVPVKGGAKAAKQVVASLAQMGLPPADRSPILTLLEQHGFSPGAYTSKIAVTLEPEMAAAKAVRCIMEKLVGVMHANLPGVRDDIDSEFLHDLRVSVRRARSLLSQLKGVVDTETTARLQGQLKAMGAITGDVRDLDVYLLKKKEYVDLVDDCLKPGVLRLFQILQRKRRDAKNRMIKAMAGAGFQAAMADLDRFIQSDPAVTSGMPIGSHPIGAVAKAAIYRRYRRVVKKGRRITATTPDEKLHKLRIDCKKLRYLLEFFTSLFPEDQVKRLIRQLKQLQQNLGDFNDLSVQQGFLMQHLKTVRPQSAQVVMLAAAIGGLIVRLGVDHQRVRSRFLRVFGQFDSTENRKRFKALFA